SDMVSNFIRERNRMIEEQLVRRIEEILGRVPSDQEVEDNCERILSSSQPDREEFYWKDTFLFGVCTNLPKCHCYFDGPVIKRDVP
ncbi:MAG TPA: hypothetical protein VJ521_05360, partial [Acidobacteriota bacterium]|nr:hypothetical protein [Acidobacteriota bacterium]